MQGRLKRLQDLTKNSLCMLMKDYVLGTSRRLCAFFRLIGFENVPNIDENFLWMQVDIICEENIITAFKVHCEVEWGWPLQHTKAKVWMYAHCHYCAYFWRGMRSIVNILLEQTFQQYLKGYTLWMCRDTVRFEERVTQYSNSSCTLSELCHFDKGLRRINESNN